MNLIILLVELLLGILLFILMNTLKDKRINRIDTILIPNISLILLSSIFTKLKNYMILMLIFYLIIDYIYVFIITKQDLLIDNKNYYKNIFYTIILGILIYHFFLVKVEYAFVDMEVFKNFIWVLIIMYFYNKLNIKTIKLEKDEQKNYEEYYKEFIIVNYAKLKNKYSYLIKTNIEIENILYSFMIYEEYKKNKNIINLVKDIITKKDSYGIMNIKSDHKLSDEESIVVVKELLENKYKKLTRLKNNDERIEKLIKEKYKLNKDKNEIIKILEIITNFKNND